MHRTTVGFHNTHRRTMSMHHLGFFVVSFVLVVVSVVVSSSSIHDNNHNKMKKRYSPERMSIPVDGWGDWKYVYEPSLLPLPKEASVEHAHGIVIQDDGTLFITYVDQVDSSRCLLRWKNKEDAALSSSFRKEETSSIYESLPEFLGNKSLCQGVPHGLSVMVEETLSSNGKSSSFSLLHANNEQVLHKTNINGEILWTTKGTPPNNTSLSSSYRPTWFASQPNSPFLFLADGYGSSQIFVVNQTDGTFVDTRTTIGGHGTEHGRFKTCHGIAWDWRWDRMVVCDRENHRLEYFHVETNDPPTVVFRYDHTVSFDPLLQRPCTFRIRSEDGTAIVPFLEGSVGILNHDNHLVSVVNITSTLGKDHGFLHPHDAHFVPNTDGDFVLVTWNPGRIGYFRRIRTTMDTFDNVHGVSNQD